MVTLTSVQMTGTKALMMRSWLIVCAAMLASIPFGASAQPAASLSAERLVQEHLGIFQVVDEMLDPFERVDDRDGELTIWFRTAITATNRNAKVCAGARWLITGRLGNVGGSRKLFESHPQFKSITLVFFDVETSVKLNKKNRYRQSRALVEQARFKLERVQSLRLNMASARRALSTENCAVVAGELLSQLKVSSP